MFEAPDLVLHSQDGHLQWVELNLRDGSERDGRGEKREERRGWRKEKEKRREKEEERGKKRGGEKGKKRIEQPYLYTGC